MPALLCLLHFFSVLGFFLLLLLLLFSFWLCMSLLRWHQSISLRWKKMCTYQNTKNSPVMLWNCNEVNPFYLRPHTHEVVVTGMLQVFFYDKEVPVTSFSHRKSHSPSWSYNNNNNKHFVHLFSRAWMHLLAMDTLTFKSAPVYAAPFMGIQGLNSWQQTGRNHAARLPEGVLTRLLQHCRQRFFGWNASVELRGRVDRDAGDRQLRVSGCVKPPRTVPCPTNLCGHPETDSHAHIDVVTCSPNV